MKAFESNPAFQSQNEIDASFTDGACIFLLKMAYYESSSDMAVYLVSLCIGVLLSLLSLLLTIYCHQVSSLCDCDCYGWQWQSESARSVGNND